MKKYLVSLAVIGAMVLPAMSSLASFTMTSTALTYDGKTTVTKDSASTVDMLVHGQLSGTGNGSQVQSVTVAWPGTQQGDGVCYDVDDVILAGSRYVHIADAAVPDINTGGNVSPKIAFYDNTAHNNQDCSGTPFTTKTFTNSIHIVNAPSVPIVVVTPGTGTSGGSSVTIAELQAQIADLKALILALQSGGGSHPAWCASLNAKVAAASYMVDQTHMDNSPNAALQHFLIDNGNSIRALPPIGWMPFGYFGLQTQGAVMQAHTTCGG